ncbi:Uncharacterised protein [Nocardia otitidiscaviarum]|uniref:Uncharacterized protein n=1 Tax=Nocardia otitidiscaviarum TaxID=1823 RepID=A0A378YV31_9NOCA|nr:hypothetical protein [Nocardia otitidiscaviarum]SUA80397.1 Uncharacterised protein [Nocardia otitidiscaviarum]
MMRALLIGFALVVAGAVVPGLASAAFVLVVLAGVVWVGMRQVRWSTRRRWRGDRR